MIKVQKRVIGNILLMGVMILSGCGGNSEIMSRDALEPPVFKEVSVHDPSVIKVEDTYYVFGSHLQSAKTTDLMAWTQISTAPQRGNKLVPNASQELGEALKWGKTSTFWAGDVIRLADGKFYMYYCTCKGDSPRSYLGLAVADNIEGPYKNLGVILRSGMEDEPSDDGTPYDATVHPNAVDPHTFFDKDGKLWMVYGSYSGGIYILEMDPETGFPYSGQGYGKKLLGGNHSRIEGAYVLYNKQTDYYYMFLSFGGLGAEDGYNIRVVRSRTPDGPYYDAEDKDMIDCKGAEGTFFDDRSIEPYGVKLMGSYAFSSSDETNTRKNTGYRSPGHNSAYYDEEKDAYFLFFHTRFEGRANAYEVRVHQMFFNKDGWPVVVPHRFAGESLSAYRSDEILGTYKFISHGKDISGEIKKSQDIILEKRGKVTGAIEGKWKKTKNNEIELTLDGSVYKGYFIRAWDQDVQAEVMCFTAVSKDGVTVWGSKSVINSK
ncbi:glycoside hydrolase family 43 protein [Cellulosilyticum sp. I15G10I2]|uniref:glycoside hydrolase family 43 protein n=1 Tax=Cellulosilyticum sp. I15G10I2 TaxID=1892843 RepID=UPI000AE47C47|nr:glycoside hydrolase family 43 protein [Cellulosilyticum sp. I15G10I2]